MSNYAKYRRPYASMLIAGLVASGCSEQDNMSDIASTTAAQYRLNLTLQGPSSGAASPAPQLSALQPRDYNPNNLELIVRLNGVDAQASQVGDTDQFEVSGMVTGNTVDIGISWSEIFQQSTLQLATFSDRFNLSPDAQFVVTNDEYNSAIFDNDKDGDSNLQERIDDTNPLNSNECSNCRTDVDVHVNRIAESDAPIIDGRYDGIWNSSQFKDLQSNLFIRNLVSSAIDAPGITTVYDNGIPPFRWSSMYDGEFLYLLIFGETGNNQTPFRDSGTSFADDDSVYIAINSINGVQEYLIPLIDSSGGENSTQIDYTFAPANGGAVRDAVDEDVAFDTCLCTGDQSIWEVRIPLTTGDNNVSVGERFRLTMDVIDDADGDSSDFRWRWPARNTTFSGTVVLRR